MSQNGPFGIDPEEFDRLAREAGEGLRDALDRGLIGPGGVIVEGTAGNTGIGLTLIGQPPALGLDPALRDAWRARTGTELHEAMGMSECSTFLSGSPARPAPPSRVWNDFRVRPTRGC